MQLQPPSDSRAAFEMGYRLGVYELDLLRLTASLSPTEGRREMTIFDSILEESLAVTPEPLRMFLHEGIDCAREVSR